jgi:alkaline phosphatase D
MRSIFLALLLSPAALPGQAPDPLDPMRSGPDSTLAPFYHGVASGDPLADRVILWTRVTTEGADVELAWRVALDTAMSAIVAEGSVVALADNDHTVRVDVTGLQPFTFYYYEFEAPDGRRSVRGRTRTLPVGAGVDSLRFAVVSCSNYAHGFFNAYDRIRERNDVFAVIHLGDYIYEYGDGEFGNERGLDPSYEILDLGDYRVRHSHYKLDPDLMRLHQQYPFFSVWDDHETANNSWMGGAQNHSTDEGDWFARKSAGIRAYAEWMPLRLPDPTDTLRIYRRFDFGDLLTLHMLDTRLIGRQEQGGENTAPERTLLGAQQYDWLSSGMSASPARWQVLGQQVMMAPLRAFGVAVNDDQWDGYPAERQRVYDHVIGNDIRNMVVLTGDIHTSWANDLPLTGYNALTGANSAGVEFVTTSVTSTSFNLPIPNLLIQVLNSHVKHVDLTRRGYLIFDVNRERVQGDWYYLNTVTEPDAQEQVGASRQSVDQSRHLIAADAPSVAGTTMIGVPAPFAPRNDLGVATLDHGRGALLVGAYPNPFTDRLDLHYFTNGNAEVTAQLFDGNGRMLVDRALGRPGAGIHRQRIQLPALPEGVYLLRLVSGEGVLTTRLVKVDRP